MEVSYKKGIASHHGPESCLDRQQCDGEALTGENTGVLKSSENTQNCRQTLYNEGESTINHTEKARDGRLRHVWKLPTRKSGDPVSTHVNGKRQKGSINEGENPKH